MEPPMTSQPVPQTKWIRYRQEIIRLFLRFWPIIIGGALLFFVLSVILTYAIYVKDIATPEALMNRNNTGLILYDRNKEPLFKSEGVKEFQVVPDEQIPDIVKEATVAIEDKDFYKHSGFSLPAIARALWTNVRTNEAKGYGASTITQQLVKNALLSPEKAWSRKYQELILAVEVDRRYTKDQILGMYLNSIYYGAGAYGISEASQIYFGKELEDLTLEEAAVLAALPQAPSRYSPFGGDIDALTARKHTVLDRMAEQGYISRQEADEMKNSTVKFIDPPAEVESADAPHFAVWLRNYLYQKYGESDVNRLGFRVTTTLDLNLQKSAQDIVKRQVEALASQDVTNGGLVSIDPHTGELLVMVGSYDWSNEEFGKYNIAFALRQPGSSFKPIVYTQAFREGIKPNDILHDKPTDFGNYKPKNYDGRFRGDITVRKALANSLNVPAVELLQTVGIQDTLDLAKSMGIHTLTDSSRYGLSLVLGGGEVELLELTRAYGVLATGGLLVPTHPILSIEDKFGNMIYQYNPNSKQETDNFKDNPLQFFTGGNEPFANQGIGGSGDKRVLKDSEAYITTHILSDNQARSETFGSASALLLSRPAAAKTGTTDDYRDSWTVGYTPDIVTGVWIGNNDNSPMGRVAGSVGAAPIWNRFMEIAHRGKTIRQFPRPSTIVEVRVCKNSSLKACNDCQEEDRYAEIFIKGSEPKNICPEELSPTPQPTSEETPTPTDEPKEEPTETPKPTDVPQPTNAPTPTSAPSGTTPTPVVTIGI